MHRQDGFTMIELLMVILIIGLLASIAIPVFNGQRNKARNGATIANLKNAWTSARAFEAGEGSVLSLTPVDIMRDQPNLTVEWMNIGAYTWPPGPPDLPGVTANPRKVYLYTAAAFPNNMQEHLSL